MTQYNKTTLKTFYENGDVPTGADYANFIDSYVNQVETAEQAMAGALKTTEVIASRVSAGNMVVTGTLSVTGATNFIGLVSAATLNVGTTATIGTTLTVGGDVSANTGTVYASAARITTTYNPVATISAAGTTQGTGSLCSAAICRLAGVTDGSTTGFSLMANRAGWTQDIYGANASANLWPPTGGTINALGANLPFALAINTGYRIIHLAASAYSVK